MTSQGTARVWLAETGHFPVDREEAFDYITNPGNWPQYWPDLVEIPELAQVKWGNPGDTVSLRMRLAGRTTDLHLTLEEFERPSLVRYRSVQRGLPEVRHERHFTPVGVGFTYHLVVAYRARRGLSGLLDRTVLKHAVRRAMRRTLQNLYQRLRA